MAPSQTATSKPARATAHIVGARKSSARSTPRGSASIKVKKTKKTSTSEASSVKQPQKRGPKEHFLGEEAAYLWARAPSFQSASDVRATGEMTLVTATDLVSTFGEGAFHDDITTKVPMVGQRDKPDDDETTEVATKVWTQPEADAHAARLEILSTVSYHC